MDTKIENVNKELNSKLINLGNDAVLREAQNKKEMEDLRQEIKSLRLKLSQPQVTVIPPQLPPLPEPEHNRPNAAQAPIDYIRENIKKH
jgi:hypothetical protein